MDSDTLPEAPSVPSDGANSNTRSDSVTTQPARVSEPACQTQPDARALPDAFPAPGDQLAEPLFQATACGLSPLHEQKLWPIEWLCYAVGVRVTEVPSSGRLRCWLFTYIILAVINLIFMLYIAFHTMLQRASKPSAGTVVTQDKDAHGICTALNVIEGTRLGTLPVVNICCLYASWKALPLLYAMMRLVGDVKGVHLRFWWGLTLYFTVIVGGAYTTFYEALGGYQDWQAFVIPIQNFVVMHSQGTLAAVLGISTNIVVKRMRNIERELRQGSLTCAEVIEQYYALCSDHERVKACLRIASVDIFSTYATYELLSILWGITLIVLSAIRVPVFGVKVNHCSVVDPDPGGNTPIELEILSRALSLLVLPTVIVCLYAPGRIHAEHARLQTSVSYHWFHRDNAAQDVWLLRTCMQDKPISMLILGCRLSGATSMRLGAGALLGAMMSNALAVLLKD